MTGVCLDPDHRRGTAVSSLSNRSLSERCPFCRATLASTWEKPQILPNLPGMFLGMRDANPKIGRRNRDRGAVHRDCCVGWGTDPTDGAEVIAKLNCHHPRTTLITLA